MPWVILIAILVFTRLIGLNGSNHLFLILFGLTAVYYFKSGNPHQSYKNHVSITFLLWIVAFQLKSEFYPSVGLWVPAVSAALFSYFYFQRFKARTESLWVDYIKLIAVIALVPATYLDYIIAPVVTPIIVMLLTYTFLLDRLIIRRKMNKTTLGITFSVLILICLSFLIYSFIKADEAEKSRIEAENQRSEMIRVSGEYQNSLNEAVNKMKRQEAQILELKDALESCNPK